MEREAKIGIVNVQESAPKSKEDKFKNTSAFLKTAIAEGAHLKIPFYVTGRDKAIRRISEEEWVRQKNIVGIYFGSPATLEEIGRVYRVTREMVRLIKKSAVYNLWKNCSLETQKLFPFQEIALDKPLSQKSKERSSRSGGGVSINIRDQMALGKSVKQIREEGSYSSQQISSARRILKEWREGEVPYIYLSHSQNLELENKLRNAKIDKEKQELLNQVKRRFYHDHVKGEKPLLDTATNIVLEAGLMLGFRNQNVTIFIESLKNVRFPMGELEQKVKVGGGEIVQKYRFVLARDKERAKQILLADSNLQRFRRS